MKGVTIMTKKFLLPFKLVGLNLIGMPVAFVVGLVLFLILFGKGVYAINESIIVGSKFARHPGSR